MHLSWMMLRKQGALNNQMLRLGCGLPPPCQNSWLRASSETGAEAAKPDPGTSWEGHAGVDAGRAGSSKCGVPFSGV